MARVLTNAVGEVVMPLHEVEQLARRLMKLSLEEIDALWCACGWYDTEARAEGMQALPRARIETMKYSFAAACEHIENLIMDTPRNEREAKELFKQQLAMMEGQRCGSRIAAW